MRDRQSIDTDDSISYSRYLWINVLIHVTIAYIRSLRHCPIRGGHDALVVRDVLLLFTPAFTERKRSAGTWRL